MASLDIELVPLLKDNYAYLLHDSATGTTAVVDPSEARPVLAVARARGWRITHVLSTHHHWDHTGGNLEIKQATGCMVVGPGYDQERIPGIDAGVEEGDRFALGGAVAEILFIPGHTRGHIAYWFPRGGGRALRRHPVLARLRPAVRGHAASRCGARSASCARLPAETRVYCGHEYTQANARFALTIEPLNPALVMKQRARRRGARRRPRRPCPRPWARSAPPTLSCAPTSRRWPPRSALPAPTRSTVFAEVRRRKDSF